MTRLAKTEQGAASGILDALEPVEYSEADLLAIVLWTRLHLLRLGIGDRRRTTADLERLEAMATSPSPGEIGWGLGRAWDAFGDGTVNPIQTIYTYQTALAGFVLTDAHAVLEEPRWRALAVEAVRTLMTRACCWEAAGALSVWYSDHSHDQLPHLQKHDVNALTAGLLARLDDDDGRWSSRRQAMVKHLVAEQGAGLPPNGGNDGNWRFGAARRLPKGLILHRPSDLLHQCLIVLGLQEVPGPHAHSAVQRALDSIVATHFDAHGRPADGVFTRGVRGWGPPSALFVLARSGRHRRATERIGRTVTRSIGSGGLSSLASFDEPRAQAWFALALAQAAVSRR